MVHLKSDVMKITYYMHDQYFVMFKAIICHWNKQNYYS